MDVSIRSGIRAKVRTNTGVRVEFDGEHNMLAIPAQLNVRLRFMLGKNKQNGIDKHETEATGECEVGRDIVTVRMAGREDWHSGEGED